MPAERTCPVCGTAASNGSDLSVHLQVEHRKSDLAALLVDDVDGAREEDLPTP